METRLERYNKMLKVSLSSRSTADFFFMFDVISLFSSN